MTPAAIVIIVLVVVLLIVGVVIYINERAQEKERERKLAEARLEAMRYQRPAPRPTYTSPVVHTTTLELKKDTVTTSTVLPTHRTTVHTPKAINTGSSRTVTRGSSDDAVILPDYDDTPLIYSNPTSNDDCVIDMYKGSEPGHSYSTPAEPERIACDYVAPTPSYSYSAPSSSHTSSSSSHSSSSSYDSGSSYSHSHSSSSYDSGSSYSSSSSDSYSSSSSSSDSSSW